MPTLTDRYIHAVTRSLTRNKRESVAADLRELIGDLTDAQANKGLNEDDAEWAALEELGNPDELASQFRQRPPQLIGPRYYFTWQRLTVLLLLIVVPIVAVAIGVGSWMSSQSALSILGDVVGGVYYATVLILFWVTLVFAIIERTVPPGEKAEWDLAELPELSTPGRGQVTKSDTIFSLTFYALMAALIIVAQFFDVLNFQGEAVPVFAEGLWNPWLIGLLVIIACEAVLAIYLLTRGRYEWSTAGVQAILNIAFTVPAVWLLATDRVFSSELVQRIDQATGEAAGTWQTPTTQVLIVVVLAIGVWETISGFYQAYRAERDVLANTK